MSPATAAPPASTAAAPSGTACVTIAPRADICLRDGATATVPGLADRLRTAQACRPPPRCQQDQRPCNIRRDRNTGCITWQCCPR